MAAGLVAIGQALFGDVMYFLRCLVCWIRHAGHAYGDWECGMGPNGYRIAYRVCQRCDWVQMPIRENDP